MEQGTWRYRVTVEIETPEGVKSGSAVYQISSSDPLIRLPDIGNATQIQAEAIPVDLGQRGVVFALVSDVSSQNGLYQAFPTSAPTSKEGIEYYSENLKTGMKAEWIDNQPQFVTFGDLKQPLTVELVKGERFDLEKQKNIPVDDFERIFGEGVKLESIYVEITDEPLTKNIYGWLPWLTETKANIDGTRITTSNDLSNTLHKGNFIKG
ncbi:MAG: hypothetical protein GC137_06100 [Alphaproteobacteria bacterium]|nr:hypothetical protein [Alphaproteobacteria bacterium]